MSGLKSVEQKALIIARESQSIAVTDARECELANTFRKKIKTAILQVREVFDPIIKKAYQAHAEAVAQRDKFLKPLQSADNDLKDKLGKYAAEQERLALVEQRRLQAEAEEKARKEREKLEIRIEKAKVKGNIEKAEMLKEQAETIIPFAPMGQIKKPEVDGLSFYDGYDFEILDINLIPRKFLMPDEKGIRLFIKATKGMREIPGVRIIVKKIAATRI
jgi:hypothetical protein